MRRYILYVTYDYEAINIVSYLAQSYSSKENSETLVWVVVVRVCNPIHQCFCHYLHILADRNTYKYHLNWCMLNFCRKGWDLGCVCFGWKSLLEMLFRKCRCLVAHGKCIFRKCFSVDLCWDVKWFTFLFYLQISIFGK